MNYESWKIEYKKRSDDVNKLSKSLNLICGANNGGLTPDHIKASDDYKVTKSLYNIANQALKDLAKITPKKFFLMASQERRAKWNK